MRPLVWIGLCLLVLAGAWYFWSSAQRAVGRKPATAARQTAVAPSSTYTKPGSTAPQLFAAGKIATNAPAASATNRFPWRLSNTPKTLGQLMSDSHGILLENAFIDTAAKVDLSIPPNLKASGDPGAYIVQSRGPVDNAFRAQLAAAGAEIVSYIPNNAYLVTLSAGGAAALAGQAGVQTVLPYEPYYKLPASLMAYAGKSFPADRQLRVAAYPNTADATRTWLESSGPNGPQILAEDTSPFGKTFIVQNVTDVAALAQQRVIQRVEPVFRRMAANDLARVALGIATDTVTNANYRGLTGSNVVVEVNDTGIDAGHPDFSVTGSAEAPGANPPTRVFGQAGALVDSNGHGTHVAGIIAGNGSESYSVTSTNPPQGSVTNADFRGKAPAAKLYSVAGLNDNSQLDLSDYELQSAPALTNVLISNNSWNYGGDRTYDLAAASYDAAVRDALPFVTGSQPVLFVFSAGNDSGVSSGNPAGEPDTILSPATAKDVITVGALEQDRGITNAVTPLDSTNQVTPWYDGTDSSFQVASYSGRGNVGIGSEGDFGRFKPDVVAPGSFVVSTRSAQWDTAAYYNPSNYYFNVYSDQLVAGDGLYYYNQPVPGNAVAVRIVLTSNGIQPFPTNMLIYVKQSDYADDTTYDFVTSNNEVSIPPDGGAGYLTGILTNGFYFTVGNPTNVNVSYNVITEIITTNDLGNYYEVLSNLNDTVAPYYRYESGTSMSAPAVSGSLALFQDYFTNTLRSTPSPALLKALLINGARAVGNYNFVVTNGINFQGWGEPSVPNSMPYGLTNELNRQCSSYFIDQSPTNALATGARQPYQVTITNAEAQFQPLRVTLAWTDPPGNPSAAIKLVNNLDLVVSNNVTGEVYFGNDIPRDSIYSAPWDTNSPPTLDTVNNVENVYLETASSGSYTITVVGRAVNVNAVTAQTNNVVQDYALVISSGDGAVTNALSVALNPPPTLAGPVVTFVASTNTLLMNQLAGGNTPLLGTNLVGAGPGYSTNAAITLGMTNQWHFYVVTNTLGYTNAAFISFQSQTLALPRMGVFATERQFPTQPDGDLDMYVAGPGDPLAYTLTNLNPVVISNCVHGLLGDGASLGNGTGTEFVAYSNSVPNGVYYIGIKSESQEAVEYDFLPVFSEQPFSQTVNGNEIVNGLLLPVAIPDGDNARPGVAYVFALAVHPIEVQDVIITNQIYHQQYGDLVGLMTHGNKGVVLNNHNSSVPPGLNTFIYDQSPAPIPGSQVPDGPGSLLDFQGQQGIGPWILSEVDESITQTGAVTGLTLKLTPHVDLGNQGVHISILPRSWFYGYIDVPAGATNLTIAATNVLSVGGIPPLQLYERLGSFPTTSNYDKTVTLTNGTPPGGSISVGPSDVPPIQPGRYFVGIYNGSQAFYNDVFVIASISLGQADVLNFGADGPTNILDDAVIYSSVFVTNTLPIASVSVGLRVEHPRISDLVFHLISPDGTRYLLMENRGGTSTNGCGATIYTTNIVNASAAGGSSANTNYIDVGAGSGTLTINYNFYPVPDQMTVYASTNPADFYLASPTRLLNTGFISNTGQFNLPFTTASGYLTIIMNQFGNADTNTLWTYSAGGVQTNFYYLVLTQDTNLTTTPIKFAPPPFVPAGFYSTNFTLSDFESAAAGDYVAPSTVTGTGWQVLNNQVSVVNDPANAYQGSQFLALANGVISNNIPTVPGGKYTLNYAYRGPGIVGFWRGEGNADDSVATSSGTANSISYTNGEVGQSFVFNGSSSYVKIPANANLNVGLGNGFTLEGWISPNDLNLRVIYEWNSGVGFVDAPTGVHMYSSVRSSGDLYANLEDTTQVFHIIASPGGVITPNTLQHVALTYDKVTGKAVLYRNGTAVASSNLGVFTPQTSFDYYLGYRPAGSGAPHYFAGLEDESSIYQRVLSPSEIKAIYGAGHAGKFNNNLPFAQNLAEATVSIPGGSSSLIFGDNTNWLQQTISFTATGTSTPIVISGLQPGMLLDNFTVFGSGGGGNLYYLPEQSLDALVGSSPYGLWQLEIQDDRVGATNRTVLDSWAMQFVFADTNPVPGYVNGGITNFIPPGGLAWYLVNVPTNADFATNILTFATGPLNMWYSTNEPPTITNPPGDVELLTAQTAGSYLLGTTGYPNIVPGGSYYLGIQNPSTTLTVQYGLRVDFHLVTGPVTNPFAFTQPATLITGTSAQLNGMATPNGLAAFAWFEWGTNTAYGNQTAPVAVGAGFNVIYTAAQISGLLPNVPYHYRLVVSNAQTMAYGFDQIFDQSYVAAWGADYLGQANVPAGLSNVVAIAGAFDHSLALKNNGVPVAWGDNAFGQATVPVNLSNVVGVAGGSAYSLALKSDGTVYSWGANLLNQTNVPAGLNNVINIAGGTYASLALKIDGSVVAWGAGFFNLTNVPSSVSNAVAVSGGSYHNLALINNGTVKAWGDDSVGQTNVPTGLTNVVAISAGSYHSLALRYNGTVVAWGDNSAGQSSVPASLSNVVAIAAGGFQSMAITRDGAVVAWGDNSAGQTSVPVGLSNVVAIAGGYLHSLALSPYVDVNPTNPIVFTLLDGVPQTNSILGGGVIYYKVSVPTNADFATNLLLYTISGPLNVWLTTNTPPTIATGNDVLLLAGVTNGVSVFSTNGVPKLVPGSVYYLGVQNQNSVAVNFGIEVDFHLIPPPNTPPVLPPQMNYAADVLNQLVVTNTATDAQSPPQILTYTLTSIVTGTSQPVINPGTGIITWTPDRSQAGSIAVLTTVVTDNGIPPMSDTNSFVVTVNPLPGFSSVVPTNGGFLLTWFAPSNDLFLVQWADRIPPMWQTFTNPPYVSYNPAGFTTATNAEFDFFDDGSETGTNFGSSRFYQLILLAAVVPLTNNPVIQAPTSSQTAELGATVDFPSHVTGYPPLRYQWFFNGAPLTYTGPTNYLELTNVDFPASGTYSYVVTNDYGAATSGPIQLNVIVPVQRRLVPGIELAGEVGSTLDVEYSDALNLAGSWMALASVTLTNPPDFAFDLSVPLPPYRLYRASQPAPATIVPTLSFYFIPAITLTGNVGDNRRLDYINQFGPINAWNILSTITLTNTTQLYFDTTVIGQPPRLYRIIPLP